MNLLFTYGTMRKGCYNNNRLDNANYVGSAKTVHKYTMVAVKEPRPIPYIFKPDWKDFALNRDFTKDILKQNHIVGDLYEVNDEDLSFIDSREGSPYYYKRKVIPVWSNNVKMYAFAYIMDKTLLPQKYTYIPSGDFATFHDFSLGYKFRKEIVTPNWGQFTNVGIRDIVR